MFKNKKIIIVAKWSFFIYLKKLNLIFLKIKSQTEYNKKHTNLKVYFSLNFIQSIINPKYFYDILLIAKLKILNIFTNNVNYKIIRLSSSKYINSVKKLLLSFN